MIRLLEKLPQGFFLRDAAGDRAEYCLLWKALHRSGLPVRKLRRRVWVGPGPLAPLMTTADYRRRFGDLRNHENRLAKQTAWHTDYSKRLEYCQNVRKAVDAINGYITIVRGEEQKTGLEKLQDRLRALARQREGG